MGTTRLRWRRTRLTDRARLEPANRRRAIETRFRTEFGLEFDRPTIAFRAGHAPEVANVSLRRRLTIRS